MGSADRPRPRLVIKSIIIIDSNLELNINDGRTVGGMPEGLGKPAFWLNGAANQNPSAVHFWNNCRCSGWWHPYHGMVEGVVWRQPLNITEWLQ